MKLTTLKSAAVGAIVGAVMTAGTAALAGTGIGDVFNLGQSNTVNATSDLSGNVAAPQLRVTNTNAGGTAVLGRHAAASGDQPGIYGETKATSANATGVFGYVSQTTSAGDSSAVKGLNAGAGRGVTGQSTNGAGVFGTSKNQYGVWGIGSYGVVAGGSKGGVWSSTDNLSGAGVYGQNTAGGTGILGKSTLDGPGSYGVAGEGRYGIVGTGKASGVWARGDSFAGVEGHSTTGSGVYGKSDSWNGVRGDSNTQAGVAGMSNGFDGVYGETKSANNAGVSGHGGKFGLWGLGSTGVYGQSKDGGFAMQANGHVTQGIGWGGFVKAMIFWDPSASGDNKVVRCFNSQLPPAQSTVPPCGFKALPLAGGDGAVDVYFGFRTTYRFMMVTPVRNRGDIGMTLEDITDLTWRGDSWIRVNIFYSAVNWFENSAARATAPFYLIVF